MNPGPRTPTPSGGPDPERLRAERRRRTLAAGVVATFALVTVLRAPWEGLDPTRILYTALPALIALVLVLGARPGTAVTERTVTTALGLAMSGPVLGGSLLRLILWTLLFLAVVGAVITVRDAVGRRGPGRPPATDGPADASGSAEGGEGR